MVAGDAGDLIRVTTTSGAVTITLPTISTVSDGFKIAIVKWTGDANAVTVARSSTNTINGATSVTIGAQYSSTIFVADFETNQWFAASSGLGTSNIAVDAFSGNNSTVAFTLSADPGSENNTQVYVSGVYQEKDTYSVSGTTLTFSTAPPTGTSNIEVVSSAPLAIGTPSDGTVTTAKLASTTGSGAVVLATSPTLTTPALGTPSALVLTNATSLPAAQLTGTQTIPRGTLPTGSVLQVVQGIKTDTFVSSATVTDTAVTGLTVSITPTSASSKILVFVNLGIGAENGQGGATKLTRTISATVTQLSLADAAGSRSRGSFAGSAYRGNASNYTSIFGHQGLTYLDSPTTTSAITYGVQVSSLSNGTYINRTEADANGNDTYRGVSYITVMEIAA